MECRYRERVNEQSQTGTTIKREEEAVATYAVHIDNKIDLNHLKQETGLVQSMKSEPPMFVKKEIAENSGEDDSEQQCTQVASTPAGAGSVYEANSTSQGDCINVKPELEEIDIGPTVLQHMDIHYALKKNTVDGCHNAMRWISIKERVEDKSRDYLTPQKTMKKKLFRVLQSLQHTLQEHHLPVCSVHVMKLDIFQCDLCHTVYAEKLTLVQHVQAVHACRTHTSLNVKFRKTNKQTAIDTKASDCGQTMDVECGEAHMKSHLRHQKYLQKHLHQHRTTRSVCFKCDSTFHKTQYTQQTAPAKQQKGRQDN